VIRSRVCSWSGSSVGAGLLSPRSKWRN